MCGEAGGGERGEGRVWEILYVLFTSMVFKV